MANATSTGITSTPMGLAFVEAMKSAGDELTPFFERLAHSTMLAGETMPRYTILTNAGTREVVGKEATPIGYMMTGAELRALRLRFPWLIRGMRVVQPTMRAVWHIVIGPSGEQGAKWAEEVNRAITAIRVTDLGPSRRQAWQPKTAAHQRTYTRDPAGYIPIIIHASGQVTAQQPDDDDQGSTVDAELNDALRTILEFVAAYEGG